MKVFISWSGDTSHKVAKCFRDWLPNVIQAIEPYVSSEDIDKGARWSKDIAQELSDSSYGILCLTKDNIHAPWLNFEAGALSKAMDSSRVSPFLFDLKRSEVNGPILQFQSTIYEKDDTKKLVGGLNQACGDKCLSEPRLNEIFDVWWPKLNDSLSEVPKYKQSEGEKPRSGKKATEDILEEVLELSRQQNRMFATYEKRFDELDIRMRSRQITGDHPALREIFRAWSELKDVVDLLELSEDQGAILAAKLDDLRSPIRHLQHRFGPNRLASRDQDWHRRSASAVTTKSE